MDNQYKYNFGQVVKIGDKVKYSIWYYTQISETWGEVVEIKPTGLLSKGIEEVKIKVKVVGTINYVKVKRFDSRPKNFVWVYLKNLYPIDNYEEKNILIP